MRLTFFVILLLTATFQNVDGQEQGYRFESRVEVVAVDVAVTRDNKPVNGERRRTLLVSIGNETPGIRRGLPSTDVDRPSSGSIGLGTQNPCRGLMF